MLKTGELLDVISRWIDDGAVGNFVIYHPPLLSRFGCYLEQTIKAREMNDETREALETLIRNLGADRGEFFCDKEGKPDRVKIVRTV